MLRKWAGLCWWNPRGVVETGALQRSNYISLLFKVLPFPLSYSPTFFFKYFQCNRSKSNTRHQVGCRLQSHLRSSSSSSSGAHLPPSSPKPWHQSVAPYGHLTSFTVNLPCIAIFIAGVLLDPDIRPLTLPESCISKSRRTLTFCTSISPANIRDSQCWIASGKCANFSTFLSYSKLKR